MKSKNGKTGLLPPILLSYKRTLFDYPTYSNNKAYIN